jgi:hypothetical protein
MTVLLYVASIMRLGIAGVLTIINGWILFRQLRGKPLSSAAPILCV